MYAPQAAILIAAALVAIRGTNAEASVFAPAAQSALDAILRDAGHGRRSPLEQALLRDAGDGRLQQHSLAEAALIASGVQDPVRLQYYAAKLTNACGELEQSGVAQQSDQQRTQAVFEFMHARLLTGQ